MITEFKIGFCYVTFDSDPDGITIDAKAYPSAEMSMRFGTPNFQIRLSRKQAKETVDNLSRLSAELLKLLE